jgi:hypothetical protein
VFLETETYRPSGFSWSRFFRARIVVVVFRNVVSSNTVDRLIKDTGESLEGGAGTRRNRSRNK